MDLDQLLDPERLAEIWASPTERRPRDPGGQTVDERLATERLATEQTINERLATEQTVDERLATERLATELQLADTPTAVTLAPAPERATTRTATELRKTTERSALGQPEAPTAGPDQLTWPALDTRAAFLQVQESVLALFADAPAKRALLHQALAPMAEALGLPAADYRPDPDPDPDPSMNTQPAGLTESDLDSFEELLESLLIDSGWLTGDGP